MSKGFYRVCMAKYGWIVVEAKNPSDAMRIAGEKRYEVDDEIFDDSDVEVDSCESYQTDIDELEDDEMIYTEDENMTTTEYLEMLEVERDDRKEMEKEGDR